jgi:hypothetical protein
MKLAEFLRLFPDVKLTSSELSFCLYLEIRGQRFLIDFGYANAADKAWELMDLEDVGLGVRIH